MAENAPRGLTDADLPGLFEGANAASLQGQRRHVRAVSMRLTFAVVAAATGVASIRVGPSGVDLMAIGTVLALVIVITVEVYLKSMRPEDAWYDGRALAESAKSLSWRYAVGAAPFQLRDEKARASYIQVLAQLVGDIPTGIRPTNAPAVTTAMRELRESPLAARRTAYLQDRVTDQRTWYARKAQRCEAVAYRWGLALLVIEALGILAALSRAVGLVEFDLAGLVAALIAAGAAWLAVRQYATNARAYTFAANELTIVYAQLEPIEDEDTWAVEVANAEEAVSREHTMWRASRSAS
jgi:SMODS and SLOG-associating 2TM effector domain 3/SMODS and SLOG-associating 2TM effector domain 1